MHSTSLLKYLKRKPNGNHDNLIYNDQPISISVSCGYHLREVNYNRCVIAVQHDVKLVEVAMYEANLRKLNYHIHQLVI